jgi:hypothetical protein
MMPYSEDRRIMSGLPLITQLPRGCQAVEKLSVACLWPSIRLRKPETLHFGALKADLGTADEPGSGFFNTLVSSRKSGLSMTSERLVLDQRGVTARVIEGDLVAGAHRL